MSICCRWGPKMCHWRHAFILASIKGSVAPMPGRTKLRLSSSFERNSKNNLYQMVKKRTLEARSKLQHDKFPNQQACTAKPQKFRQIPARPPYIPPYQNKPTNRERTESPGPKRPKLCTDPESPENATDSENCALTGAKTTSNRTMLHTEKGIQARAATQPCKELGSKQVSESCPTTVDEDCLKANASGASAGGASVASAAAKSSPSTSKKDPEPCADTGASGRDIIEPCLPSKDKCGDDAGGKGVSGGGGGAGSGGAGGSCMGGAGDGKQTDKCKPPPGPPKGSCEDDKPKYLLWGLLAALGLGGLLWLLLRKKDTCDTDKMDSKGEGDPPVIPTVPAESTDLPNHVPYLLIGGGTAAFSAFRAIKSNDPRAKVLMITKEHRKPYMRPPLSKELWYSAQTGDVSKDYRFKQWTGSERSLYFEPEEFFVDPRKLMDSVNGGIAVAHGFSVRKVDPQNKIVTLSDGYEISYDECLIATGCSPKTLPVFTQASPTVKEKVMLYRSPEDFDRLKRYADEKKSITVVGNGFTGSELACSLANYGKSNKDLKIYQIFPEVGNMSKVLPKYLSKWTTGKVEAMGVCVMPETSIVGAQRDEESLKLTLSNGKSLFTDVVVVCVGCEPNTSIALTSGLEVDRRHGGFVVNSELEARRNLFVAGDASCFYDPLLGRRRVEHHDHSVVSGRLAGENMVGKKKAYNHQSMFWSDLGPEIGYEGIGLVDASLPTVGVFALPSPGDSRHTDNLNEAAIEKAEENLKSTTDMPDVKCDPEHTDEYGRGVIFYLKDNKIVGILLWNLFNRIGLARTVINQNKAYEDLNEVAKLFELHA